MKEAFKQAYERELKLLKERAAVFARDFPGHADKLGGLLEENLDPSIKGLLEGSAFLAARVQLNIDQRFRVFSNELLEQLWPNATAPLPSSMLVRARAKGKPADLALGRKLNAGNYLDATFSKAERRISCRFRLAEPLQLWPLALESEAYHASTTALTALGIESAKTPRKTEAGMIFTLSRTDGKSLKELPIETLPIHFTGPQPEAFALYEQAFSSLVRVSLRWQDKNDEPVFRTIPVSNVEQVGFDSEYPLFGADDRLFPGCSTLLEWFSFPRKFLGLRLSELSQAFRGIDESKVQVIFEFAEPSAQLKDYFGPHSLGLFCAPAVNLFRDDAKPVDIDKKRHRQLVSPNRTPINNYEILRIEEVRAEYEGYNERVEVLPLYALPTTGHDPRASHYYTVERVRRSLTRDERKLGGTSHRYEGTESWITLFTPTEGQKVSQLFVKTLCSNRHLPEVLPISDAKFSFLEDKTISFDCVAGPSEPREALAEIEKEGPHRYDSGDNYWRLISFLSLSQRGFIGADQSGNVANLHEMLRLFADISNQLTDAQINAVHAMTTRPCTRTVQRREGYLTTRGLEISLTFDEAVYDLGTIIALSAVLNHFFAEYAAINSFTQLVVKNRRGKKLHTWPPRGGSGPLL